jgi:hypothetical protein
MLEFTSNLWSIFGLSQAMAAQQSNSTVAFERFVSAPFSFLSDMYSAAASVIPFRFSLVQQVHVKLKAEAVVMFAFCFVKQAFTYFKDWQAKREARRLEAAKGVAIAEKKRRKRGRKRGRR